MNDISFEKRISIEQVEESTELAPKFDQNGLIPVVTTDYTSGEVLMQGYMNEEALKQTSFKAREICHVGDHPVNDVQGSNNFGMKSIWFNEKGLDWPLEAKTDYVEVRSWAELEKIVETF